MWQDNFNYFNSTYWILHTNHKYLIYVQTWPVKDMALAHLKVIKILKGILQMLRVNNKTKKARIPEYDV